MIYRRIFANVSLIPASARMRETKPGNLTIVAGVYAIVTNYSRLKIRVLADAVILR